MSAQCVGYRVVALLALTCVVHGCAFNTPAPYLVVDSSPSYSPSGDRIAFLSKRITKDNPLGATRVWIMRSDGSEQRPLGGSTRAYGRPKWSPDGEELLLWNPRPFDIWRRDYVVVDLTGTVLRRLRNPGKGLGCIGYHPKQPALLWLGPRGESLWLTDLEGGDARRIGEFGTGYSASADWSRIVYYKRHYHTFGQYLVWDVEQEMVRTLEPDPVDGRRRWIISPDGSTLAFASDSGELSLMDFDGENVRQLTHSCAGSLHSLVQFSEDGQLLLCRRSFPAQRWGFRPSFCLVRADGSGCSETATTARMHLWTAVLSPDSRHILCWSGPRMNRGLYLLTVEGNQWRRLSPDASRTWLRH